MAGGLQAARQGRGREGGVSELGGGTGEDARGAGRTLAGGAVGRRVLNSARAKGAGRSVRREHAPCQRRGRGPYRYGMAWGAGAGAGWLLVRCWSCLAIACARASPNPPSGLRAAKTARAARLKMGLSPSPTDTDPPPPPLHRPQPVRVVSLSPSSRAARPAWCACTALGQPSCTARSPDQQPLALPSVRKPPWADRLSLAPPRLAVPSITVRFCLTSSFVCRPWSESSRERGLDGAVTDVGRRPRWPGAAGLAERHEG